MFPMPEDVGRSPRFGRKVERAKCMLTVSPMDRTARASPAQGGRHDLAFFGARKRGFEMRGSPPFTWSAGCGRVGAVSKLHEHKTADRPSSELGAWRAFCADPGDQRLPGAAAASVVSILGLSLVSLKYMAPIARPNATTGPLMAHHPVPPPSELSFLAVVPARSGSKRIPEKNTRLLAGKPLVVWTIEAARTCPRLENVIVSTDSSSIAEVARAAGADVPFMRPAALATDTAATVDVIRHASSFIEAQGRLVTAVVTLQPTSPLRTGADIEAALELFSSDPTRAVVSVSPAPSPVEFMMRIVGDELVPVGGAWPQMRTQDARPAYVLNGAIFITPRELLDRGSLVGPRPRPYVMPRERSIDIDDELDWRIAEELLR